MKQEEPSLRMQFVRFSRNGAWHSLAAQALIGTSVLMIAALILIGTMLSQLERSRLESVATHDTMLEITTIETRLVEIDSMLRGYALTSDPWYLDTLKIDHTDIHVSLDKLEKSLQSDPVQLKKLKGIVSQIQQRIALDTYLGQTDHRSEIVALSVTQSSRAVHERIRKQLWEILDGERAKRQLNNTTMISQARNSLLIAMGIIFLTFTFGALCLVLSIFAKAGASFSK